MRTLKIYELKRHVVGETVEIYAIYLVKLPVFFVVSGKKDKKIPIETNSHKYETHFSSHRCAECFFFVW